MTQSTPQAPPPKWSPPRASTAVTPPPGWDLSYPPVQPDPHRPRQRWPYAMFGGITLLTASIALLVVTLSG